MSVPDKNMVINRLSEEYQCSFSTIKGKQIMFQGYRNGKKLVLCTPASKIHVNGNGWFDLNISQVEFLDNADVSILAVRLEGEKIFYVDFKELRKLMTTKSMTRNKMAGEHWKLYIWPNYIEVLGNKERFTVQAERVHA